MLVLDRYGDVVEDDCYMNSVSSTSDEEEFGEKQLYTSSESTGKVMYPHVRPPGTNYVKFSHRKSDVITYTHFKEKLDLAKHLGQECGLLEEDNTYRIRNLKIPIDCFESDNDKIKSRIYVHFSVEVTHVLTCERKIPKIKEIDSEKLLPESTLGNRQNYFKTTARIKVNPNTSVVGGSNRKFLKLSYCFNDMPEMKKKRNKVIHKAMIYVYYRLCDHNGGIENCSGDCFKTTYLLLNQLEYYFFLNSRNEPKYFTAERFPAGINLRNKFRDETYIPTNVSYSSNNLQQSNNVVVPPPKEFQISLAKFYDTMLMKRKDRGNENKMNFVEPPLKKRKVSEVDTPPPSTLDFLSGFKFDDNDDIDSIDESLDDIKNRIEDPDLMGLEFSHLHRSLENFENEEFVLDEFSFGNPDTYTSLDLWVEIELESLMNKKYCERIKKSVNQNETVGEFLFHFGNNYKKLLKSLGIEIYDLVLVHDSANVPNHLKFEKLDIYDWDTIIIRKRESEIKNIIIGEIDEKNSTNSWKHQIIEFGKDSCLISKFGVNSLSMQSEEQKKIISKFLVFRKIWKKRKRLEKVMDILGKKVSKFYKMNENKNKNKNKKKNGNRNCCFEEFKEYIKFFNLVRHCLDMLKKFEKKC